MAIRTVAVESGLEALAEAARKLIAIDPARFQIVLHLMLVYVSIYETPVTSPADLLARAALIPTGNIQ